METMMLSPHELATLMLVRHAPDQIDATRIELDTLLDCQLVALESRAGERRLPARVCWKSRRGSSGNARSRRTRI